MSNAGGVNIVLACTEARARTYALFKKKKEKKNVQIQHFQGAYKNVFKLGRQMEVICKMHADTCIKHTCGPTPMQTHADIETKNIFDCYESDGEKGLLAAVWEQCTHVCPFSRKDLWAGKP